MAENLRPFITDVSGTRLSRDERDFLNEYQPVGVILFSRNCENHEQLCALTDELKQATNNKDLLILIDQEGGRVARLKAPIWPIFPPINKLGKIATRNLAQGVEATYLHHRLIAHELWQLGVNTDCAPMLDILYPEMDQIVGDRSFGNNPSRITKLGKVAAKGLLDGGVLPIIKHIPGHGRAKVDSHKALPEVTEPLEILEKTDFKPFRDLKSLPIAMTAHISYKSLDSKCATFSKKTTSYIRDKIGFKGLLVSDDISMKALNGSFSDRTKNTLSSGCDLVLHCNSPFNERVEVAKSCPSSLSQETKKRLKKAISMKVNPKPFDTEEGWEKYNYLLNRVR